MSLPPIGPRLSGGRAAYGSAPTPREIEVLAETCEHGGMHGAAACLGISYQTVKNHVSRLYARLGAASLGHALILLGWVALPAGATPSYRSAA